MLFTQKALKTSRFQGFLSKILRGLKIDFQQSYNTFSQ